MVRNFTTALVAAFLIAAVTSFAADQKTIKKVATPHTNAANGQQMYESYCAACHGKTGKGDGPAASALKTPPSDLTTLTQNNKGQFPSLHVFHTINGEEGVAAHGSKDMPVWGPPLRAISGGSSAEVQMRISNITTYVESLQAKQ
jgi:mono/diheme cytochrome c family protein